MKVQARVPTSIAFLAAMTLLVGLAYPALVTAIAQLAFPAKAGGSLVVMDRKVRGSYLLAQEIESLRFFRARPSATEYAYIRAGASNLGPTSAELARAVAERRAAWERDFGSPAPEEMLHASASGLDPDIGLEAAMDQLGRVAMARGLGPEDRARLEEAIRSLSMRGGSLPAPPRVNVTALNALLETDPAFAGRGR